ncbi:MAG: CARDB domain-containing protein, partial [candidate division KSB1 bacterium]
RVLTGNAVAYGVSFKPDEALLAGSDTVQVEILASDLAAPPNAMRPDIYNYTLSRDRVPPFTSGHNPPRLSRGASLDAQITLEILDPNPGVDASSIKLFVDGSAAELQLEQVTNGYRVRQKLKPRWRDNQTIAVKVEAQDLAAPANAMPREEYTFTTVRDSLAPTARDFSPRLGEINVAPNATISFVVEDDLTGVDRAALVLLVNGNAVQPSLQPLANGFVVRYDLSASNLPSDTVRVEVRARDNATFPNVKRLTYYFVTSQDRTPPLLTDFLPPHNAREVPINTAITFQLRDEASGVDSSSIRFFLNGESKAVKISGEPRLFQVSYQPVANFPLAQRLEIAVEARDRATPANVMPRRVFQFTTIEPLPDLIAAELTPFGSFELGKVTKVKATLRREGLAVRESFRIEFKADLNVVKDTTIAANTFGTMLQLEASARFEQAGRHSIEVLIDADDKIKEVNETNNRLQIETQIAETLAQQLTVRPNPFTPNGDAINDNVEFDFSGLTLANPTLHIFDVNGIAIFLTDRSAGKRFTWNGRDERGNEVQPGVYLYTVRDRGANVKSGYVVVAR